MEKKVVYKGITNNPEKREADHKTAGKNFTHMQQVGAKKTATNASKEETRQLEVYRKNNGNNPKYNKTKNG